MCSLSLRQIIAMQTQLQRPQEDFGVEPVSWANQIDSNENKNMLCSRIQ